MFSKKFHQLRVISILVIVSILLPSTRPFTSFPILSTPQITQIIISNSFNTANRTQNTSTPSTRFLNWTTSFWVFLTVPFAHTLALILIVLSISPANRMSIRWTRVTTVFVHFLLTLPETDKSLFIAFQLAKVSVSDSISTASRHKHFWTELATP